MKKPSKTEVNQEIEEFFSKITSKTPKEVKKIQRLAKSKNIKLGEKRKTFCRKCLNPFKHPNILVRKGFVKIICNHCENRSKWKIK
ncbi:MAG: hypothetical protein IIA85_00195 [Nanoarchaeota archaeon]|nr:hypothetical protein [Nanoarchaeota archaeon]